MISIKDKEYLLQALELSKQAGNKIASNPYVGCIIVNNNKVIGTGYHEKFGENHAEVNAINNSTQSVENSTVYVTLEPCYTFSKTPPCVDLLIKSKVKRVVIGSVDPNKNTKNKSIKKMIDNGIIVDYDITKRDVEIVNKPFFKVINNNIPYIVLKAAITLDGKIATRNYNSKWISNEKAREEVQLIRKNTSAILVGKNTIMQDNPRLKYHSDNSFSPIRIIIDAKNELKSNLKVFDDNNYILFTSKKRSDLKNTEVVDFNLSWNEIYKYIFEILVKKYNVSSILVEGGQSIMNFFIKNKLYDEMIFYVAPIILGDEKAISLINGFNIEEIKDGLNLSNYELSIVDNNIKINSKDGWVRCLLG